MYKHFQKNTTRDIKILKEILIYHKNKFITWKEINELFYRQITFFHYYSEVIKLPKEYLRMEIFPLIQQDNQWVIENGVPISKNGVGIKLSNDTIEINEYLDGEHKRAMSIMKKLAPIRAHRDRLVAQNWGTER